MKNKIILITGCAGFIGFHTAKLFLKKKFKVIGIDNVSNYYSTKLKKNRLKNLKNKNFFFIKCDISKKKKLEKIFKKYNFETIIHLAAQAGVRYSIEKPDIYFKSNIEGFYNLIELSKKYSVKFILFASSSSVYGNNKIPFKITDNIDKPIQFYAATKSFNEVAAHSYSSVYNLKFICFRFFTVYGPWGRPDMMIYKFIDSIFKNKIFKIFNKGNHKRDFTYIDDAISAIYKAYTLRKKILKKRKFISFNISSGKIVNLKFIISFIENFLKKKTKKTFIKKQHGDIDFTLGDISFTKKILNYRPSTSIEQGLKKFIFWYKEYNLYK